MAIGRRRDLPLPVGDVVGRIGEDHVGETAVERPLTSPQRGVAADQPMGTHRPDIAGHRDRIGGGSGASSGKDRRRRRAAVDLGQIEAGQRQIEAGRLQVAKLKPQ